MDTSLLGLGFAEGVNQEIFEQMDADRALMQRIFAQHVDLLVKYRQLQKEFAAYVEQHPDRYELGVSEFSK